MTLTIDLTPELEAKLRAAADARGIDAKTVLLEMVSALPGSTVAAGGKFAKPDQALPRKSNAEILAGWDAEGLPSVYGRDSEDATAIARRLRRQAETRELLK